MRPARALLCLLLSIAAHLPGYGQLQATQWRFGGNAALQFPNGGSPVILPSSAMSSWDACVSVADPITGALLFYSNGETVWDRTNVPMSNGRLLSGNQQNFQSALAVAVPGNPGRYLLFTTIATDTVRNGTLSTGIGIAYSSIDMSLSGGRGDLVFKNILLRKGTYGSICGVRKCGTSGYWIIAHDTASARFAIWSLDSAGLSGPSLQDVGLAGSSGTRDSRLTGYMKSSPDGRRIAWARGADSCVDLFDFDPSTGRLQASYPARLSQPNYTHGVSFSPDGSKLYATHGWAHFTGGDDHWLVQYDLAAGDSLDIVASRFIVASRPPLQPADAFCALQLGPDGRLYCARKFVPWISVVPDPDSAGAACGFQAQFFINPADISDAGLPNIIDGDLNFNPALAARFRLCRGDSVQLLSRSVLRPRWRPERGLSCPQCPAPIATPDSTTTYYLYDESGLVCGTAPDGPVDSATVTILERPDVVVQGDTLLCEGESTQLELKSSGLVRWLPSDEIDCSTCTRIQLAPLRTTTYRFEATGENGCVYRDSVRIVVDPLPKPDAGRDTSICSGMALELHAGGGVRYRWEPAARLDCDTCADPIARPLETTVYRLTAWNAAGCSVATSIVVNVREAPVIDAGEGGRICSGGELQLRASLATSYRWEASPDLSCLDCPAPLARPARTTTYYVGTTNGSGCRAVDSVTVIVDDSPRLVLRGDSAVCLGSSATIEASGGAGYLWSDATGPLPCADCAVQRVSPMETTTYRVIGRSAEGCMAIDSFTVRVSGTPQLVVSKDASICRGESLPLSASGAANYLWTPATGLSCSDCSDPVASPQTTTHYTVIGTLPGGCADTARVTLLVSEGGSVTAALPRGISMLPGTVRRMDLAIDREIVCDTMEFDLRWRMGIVMIDRLEPAFPLLADGWRVEIIEQTQDRLHARVIRPAPGRVASGAVLTMRALAFIGDTTATELPFTLVTSAGICTSIGTRPGEIRTDSICGLNSRLIEMGTGLIKLRPPAPNPVTGPVRIGYAIPWDAEVRLDLIDAAGVEHRLVRGMEVAGEHEVLLPTGALHGGFYICRFRVGEHLEEYPLVIVR